MRGFVYKNRENYTCYAREHMTLVKFNSEAVTIIPSSVISHSFKNSINRFAATHKLNFRLAIHNGAVFIITADFIRELGDEYTTVNSAKILG